jgi:hypothetical protein
LFNEVGHDQGEIFAHQVVAGIAQEDPQKYLQPQALVLRVNPVER